MKQLFVGLALIASAFSVHAAFDKATEPATDVQLRAMMDELARSKELKLNDLDRTYFVQYVVEDSNQVLINASLGGIIGSSRTHMRQPKISVRVGDYKFDNTNSIYFGNKRFGLFPVDDDYDAMRNQLWLGTDSLYKAAIDEITRKRNALREIADPEKTPDFSPVKAVHALETPATLELDAPKWEQILRSASNRFALHPAVAVSSIRLRAIASTYRLVNTEGTALRIPEELTDVDIRATGLAQDGTRVWNHALTTVLQPSELPPETGVEKTVDAVARETEALTKAPAGEEYSGPVLFENEAAAEMVAQVLTDAVRLHRKPVAPPDSNDRTAQILESVWAARLGSKVAPDWITIVDDPKQTNFRGSILAGHYDFDDEGVPAERVTLVEKGTLKAFLASRLPIRNISVSNGHGRLSGSYGAQEAALGNVFVQADQTMTSAKMRNKLLSAVKAAGLKYGIVIRRLDFPSTASFEQLQSIARQLQKNGYARTLNPPILAFKVYPDGHEELFRSLRFKEFSAKELRNIVAVSDEPYVFNYVNNGSGFNILDSGGEATTSTVICPSLLVEDIELARAEEEAGTPPVVPPPTLSIQ